MVYVIGGNLWFTTAARRDNAVARLNTYFQARTDDLFVPAQVGPYDGSYKGRPNSLNFEATFKTQANRDALWTQADTQLGSGVQGPVAGAILYRLDSNSDDTTQAAGTFSEVRQY